MTLNFVIFRVFAPIKDPTDLIWDPNMMPQDKARLRSMWGLDEPLFNQYLAYLRNMFTWRYGLSFGVVPKDIATEMSWRLKNTVFILGVAVLGTIAVGLPLGILAGSRRGSKTDVSVIGVGLFTWGVPTFFIQILFLVFLGYYWYQLFGWKLIPIQGVISTPPPPYASLAYYADIAWHAIAPITTLIIAGFGSWALYSRNMLVDALTEDYVLTARAKGVKERSILYRHAFRAILPPIATMVSMAIPGIFTGAIITEYIFSWPGVGEWYINAILSGNHPIAQAVLYNYAVLMIGANLVADLVYGILDPRIRVGMRR